MPGGAAQRHGVSSENSSWSNQADEEESAFSFPCLSQCDMALPAENRPKEMVVRTMHLFHAPP